VRVELTRDRLRRLRRLLVRRRASPRDHLEARHGGELASHGIRDAVGEVVVLGSPQVLERQHGHALDAASLATAPVRTLHEKHAHRGENDDGGNRDENLALAGRRRRALCSAFDGWRGRFFQGKPDVPCRLEAPPSVLFQAVPDDVVEGG
jgi:hypothetical protein